MAHKLTKTDLLLIHDPQSTARLLGIKFFDHIFLGSADCEDGRAFVSAIELGE